MILYGLLVKTESLGSTDGLNVIVPTFLGYAPHREKLLVALYLLVVVVCAAAALLTHAYFRSLAGALAIPVRDNEIRVEFLGMSVSRLIHTKLVISGMLAGIGGALAALAVGHVDPNMSYWTTSGEFVFITILAGAGSVGAAFVGSLAFESVRSFAFAMLPQLWQMLLGSVLLLTILFLPQGLGSLIKRLHWGRGAKAP
jgi:branched-chain amino acid transport system permease protein